MYTLKKQTNNKKLLLNCNVTEAFALSGLSWILTYVSLDREPGQAAALAYILFITYFKVLFEAFIAPKHFHPGRTTVKKILELCLLSESTSRCCFFGYR